MIYQYFPGNLAKTIRHSGISFSMKTGHYYIVFGKSHHAVHDNTYEETITLHTGYWNCKCS